MEARAVARQNDDGRDLVDRAGVVLASEVGFRYGGGGRGSGFALRDISLRVDAGEMVLLLGPSGSGKSTFLKLVKGMLRPQEGSLKVLGEDLSSGPSRRLKRALGSRIAWVPQHLGLVRNLTAMENVLTGALSRISLVAAMLKMFPQDEVREARELLGRLGIERKAEEKVHNLSGGERQRVAIARALMQRPELVLADEFVSHLDPVTTKEIMRLATDAARRGVTFLISTHEIELAADYGERAIFFREGRKIHEARAREITPDLVERLMKKN